MRRYYSLVETAKANGLNVYAYLNHLPLYMPDADFQNDPGGTGRTDALGRTDTSGM